MRSHIASSALSLVAVLFSPAIAETQTVIDPHVLGGHYGIETSHTQISFSVLHFGFSNYYGMFSGVSGDLNLDTKNPSSSTLEVTLPVDSVQTTSAKLTEELKGNQWFDATHFPVAKFVSTNIKRVNHNDALVSGNLTLHGVTHPEVLRVHFVGSGTNMLDKKYTVGFDATTTIKRSDFGVKMFVPYVGDEVHLQIAGAFEKQG